MSRTTTANKDLKSWQPNPDLTPEQLESMRKDVLERITVARIGLLLRHPFYGNMATRLRVKCGDDFCGTAATDGRFLYYNTQFFNALDNKEIEFVVAHEILHCVFDHFARRDHRDPQIYNIAADYIVNNSLVRDNIGSVPKLVNIFQDFKYEGWISEEVYEDIFEKYDQEQLEQLGQLLDDHLDWEKSEDDSDESEKKGQPKYTQEELRKIRSEIRESMIAAAQTAGIGNTPGAVARIIEELTEPKMNWRELLQQQIQSTVRADYTFSRPGRKAWHTNAILPGSNFEDTIDIFIALDMSGSIGIDQGKDFLGEVQGIMDEFKDYKIHIVCFDTDVYGSEVFTADDGKTLLDYNIRGGGGTDFACVWRFLNEEGIQPKKLIMFTDMGCWGSWGDPDYCDTIFVNHGGGNTEAPFGITVKYDEKA